VLAAEFDQSLTLLGGDSLTTPPQQVAECHAESVEIVRRVRRLGTLFPFSMSPTGHTMQAAVIGKGFLTESLLCPQLPHYASPKPIRPDLDSKRVWG